MKVTFLQWQEPLSRTSSVILIVFFYINFDYTYVSRGKAYVGINAEKCTSTIV